MALPNNNLTNNPNNSPPPMDQPLISSVGVNKERETGALKDERILEDVRQKLEIEIQKEVKDAGVKEIKETIELPDKVARDTGAIEVGSGVSIPKQTTIVLPLDDQKIKQAVKKNKIIDSIYWLAFWCLRQILVAKVKALKIVGIKK